MILIQVLIGSLHFPPQCRKLNLNRFSLLFGLVELSWKLRLSPYSCCHCSLCHFQATSTLQRDAAKCLQTRNHVRWFNFTLVLTLWSIVRIMAGLVLNAKLIKRIFRVWKNILIEQPDKLKVSPRRLRWGTFATHWKSCTKRLGRLGGYLFSDQEDSVVEWIGQANTS